MLGPGVTYQTSDTFAASSSYITTLIGPPGLAAAAQRMRSAAKMGVSGWIQFHAHGVSRTRLKSLFCFQSVGLEFE